METSKLRGRRKQAGEDKGTGTELGRAVRSSRPLRLGDHSEDRKEGAEQDPERAMTGNHKQKRSL